MMRLSFHRMANLFRTRARDESGAAMILVAISMTMVIASTAVAVDLGKAVSRNTDLQALADITSLDSVRSLGDLVNSAAGRTKRQFALDLARASAVRNKFQWSVSPNSLDVVLGTVNTTTRAFTAAADQTNGDSTTNAVKVNVGATVDWSFAPGSRAYTASGVAVVRNAAAMSLGSFLARVDTTNSTLLNGLVGGWLNSSLNLTLVSYQGLADLNVSLAELADAGLSAGTVDELLNVKEITVAQLIDASAAALTKRGEVLTFGGEAPFTEMKAAATSSTKVKLGQFIDIAQGGGEAAMRTGLNVLELIKAAAIVSDGDNFVQLAVPINIPGLANVSVKVGLIEKPKFYIGTAPSPVLHSAQLRAQLDVSLLNLVSGGVVQLPIYLEAGSASATMTGITCTPGTTDQGTVTVAVTPQTARAAIGSVADTVLTASTSVSFSSPATILDLIGVLQIKGTGDITVPGSPGTLTFTGPYPQTQTRSSPTLNLGALLKPSPAGSLNLSAEVFGLDLLGLGATVTAAVSVALTPVLDLIDAAVINPLLSALGISLAGGDVTIHDLWCNARTLIN